MKFKNKMHLTAEQIIQTSDNVHKSFTKGAGREKTNVEAHKIRAAELDEERIVQDIVSQWRDGGQGYVPDKKPEDIVRLTVENANSLSIFSKDPWKLKKLANLNNKYQSDATLLVETGINWSKAPEGKKPRDLFRGSGRCTLAVAHNKSESIGCSQCGGSATVAFSRLSGFVKDQGIDTPVLGHWS